MDSFRPDDEFEDINTKERKVIHPVFLGIDHAYRIGKCSLYKAQRPLMLHVHKECFEICFHFSGSQIYTINGETFQTKAGEVFITLPDELHGTGVNVEEKSGFFYFIFRGHPDMKDFMGLGESDSQYIMKTLYSVGNRVWKTNKNIYKILDSIVTMYYSNEPMSRPRIYAYILEFFYVLLQDILLQNRISEFCPKEFKELRAYIDANPAACKGVTELANQLSMSLSQFKINFKKYTGYAPWDYIMRKRIDRAKELLTMNDQSITEIAFELGFSSSQHFSAAFKKYTGCTPSGYKSDCH